MRKITAELLAEKDACPYQIDRFQERFPDGVDPETVRPEEVVDLVRASILLGQHLGGDAPLTHPRPPPPASARGIAR